MLTRIWVVLLSVSFWASGYASATTTEQEPKLSKEARRIWKDELYKSELKAARKAAEEDQTLPEVCRKSKNCLTLAARRRLILENERYAMQEAMRSCRRKRKAVDSDPEKFAQYKKECRTSVKNLKKNGDTEAIVRLALEDPIETVAFREAGGETIIATCLRLNLDTGEAGCPERTTDTPTRTVATQAPITASTDQNANGAGAY